jgi:AraC-like DNA-binding protein
MALDLAAKIPARESLAVVRHSSTGWAYYVHGHDCYECILIPSGRGDLVVGDHEASFTAPICLFLAPGLAHCFHTENVPKEGRVIEQETLYFACALVDTAAIPELEPLQPLLSHARLGVLFAGPVLERVGEAIRAINAEKDPTLRIAGVHGLLQILAGAEGRTLAQHETSSPYRREDLERLDELNLLMNRRFREPLSLDQVAHELRVSPSTVNHLLAKHHRTTFLRHLSWLRLEEAKRLLRETDDDITGIAFASGYGSLATFNRRFRREAGAAPHEFREQAR